MASAFSHALVGAALAVAWRSHAPAQKHSSSSPISSLPRLIGCAALAAAAPDLDVGMHLFVPYAHAWGHRGALHSPAIYALSAGFAVLVLRGAQLRARLWLGSLLFCCLLSHSLLDMLTDGGLGVALAFPCSDERLFFPWRPIAVSPIGIRSFFSETGRRVLVSELPWGIPALALACCYAYWRQRRRAPAADRS